jgi:fructose-bisphosphate aldolase class II
MKTLRECIAEAEAKKSAVGHFNISNIEGFWAIVRTAKNLDLPVIIGVSEGERDFVGVRQAKALVESARSEMSHPIFINADHTYSVERIKEAVDAGFDSVIFDGAGLSFDDNVKQTQAAVAYAKSKNPEILVEGELGYIGKSSKILDAVPEGVSIDNASLTTPEDAKRFVDATGVDLLAPAVGNIHGMLKGGHDPKLNTELVAAIREASGVPLVLHGGSGNSPEDFKASIAAGVAIVHINTELRVAYRDAVKKTLQENPDEVAPYKIMRPSVVAMEKVVEEKLKLFNS